MPVQIIAGAIIDTACRYWQKSPCGEKGSCLLYNAEDFRWKLHVTVACFKVITCVMDLVVSFVESLLNHSIGEEDVSLVSEISHHIASLCDRRYEENQVSHNTRCES